jgi:hypothetical protein
MGGKGSGGHNKKPIERKIRTGNPSKRKLPETAFAEIVSLGSSHVPDPHRTLQPHGRHLWDQIWQSGAGWLKQHMDTELVLMVCEATDERTRLRIRLARDPDSWRDRRALRELDRQIMALLGQIGFTPVERGTLGSGEVTKHEFSNLHQRIAQKRTSSK